MRDVLIVGGGPGGLLLGQLFQDNGIDYRIVERGLAAQAWRTMRPGMVLLSPSVPGNDWTSLRLDEPLWEMPGARKPFPSREDFLGYIDLFVRKHRLEISENTTALRATRLHRGFLVATSAGDVSCRFLVLATGAYSVPVFPKIPGLAGNPHVVHSGDVVFGGPYEGKRVIVIGGGNSAAEVAIGLAGTARVTLCTRRSMRYFSGTGRLDDIRGASESLLKELFRFGIVALREADPVTAVEGQAVRFRRGDTMEYDAILCATGYRPARFPVEGEEIRSDPKGFPVISPVGESTVPGLYVCGSLARFHARCGFIHGFRNYVEKIFWDIADRL